MEKEDTVLELRQRLEVFRRTHPYREVQVADRSWRYMTGGQGERTLLLLQGSLVPDLFFSRCVEPPAAHPSSDPPCLPVMALCAGGSLL